MSAQYQQMMQKNHRNGKVQPAKPAGSPNGFEKATDLAQQRQDILDMEKKLGIVIR